MSALAGFTDAGLQGVRLKKKRQIIKGVPRMMGSHDREVYWVFRGLSVEVAAGDTLVLVSRDPVRTNSIMRVWAGLLPLDEGEVERPARSLMLVSPQSRWARELSVEQTIRLLAGMYGLHDSEVEAIVGPAARTAQVESLLHRPIDDLGKAVRDQLAFAIAINAPVPVVMFDHTASIGTPEFRPLCLDQILALREAGKGVVVATHKPQIALHVGSRAMIVRGKRSEEVDVSAAAEFLIRDRVRGRKLARRRAEDDDDETGMEF
ncbi:MAG: hypothetical protein R2720_06285 [Candidatus Nanopelagicales bacterium]